MFTWGGSDDIVLDGFAIEGHTLHPTLLAIRILHSNLELSITQHTLHHVFLESRRNAGVYLQTIIGRLDTKNVLCDGNPVPCCRTRQP